MSTVASTLARADRMVAAGREAEARYYLRRNALSSLAYARNLVSHGSQASVRNQQAAAGLRADGIAFISAYRSIRSIRSIRPAPTRSSAVEFEPIGTTAGKSYSQAVANPHWPDLSECFHGVYVAVHVNADATRVHVEVQILTPDEARSQCCFTRRVRSIAAAERLAAIWITVGEAVIAADMPTPKRSRHASTQLSLLGTDQ